MTPGSHGSTFGGNPLAMSVGNAVLDQIFKKGFLHNVLKNSKYFHYGVTSSDIIDTAFSTNCALVASTPFSNHRLSSNPTRTFPPERVAAATYGIWCLPKEKAE